MGSFSADGCFAPGRWFLSFVFGSLRSSGYFQGSWLASLVWFFPSTWARSAGYGVLSCKVARSESNDSFRGWWLALLICASYGLARSRIMVPFLRPDSSAIVQTIYLVLRSCIPSGDCGSLLRPAVLSNGFGSLATVDYLRSIWLASIVWTFPRIGLVHCSCFFQSIWLAFLVCSVTYVLARFYILVPFPGVGSLLMSCGSFLKFGSLRGICLSLLKTGSFRGTRLAPYEMSPCRTTWLALKSCLFLHSWLASSM